MIPRGEVALIVALVGLQTGIVSMSTYGIVVLMTATTTLLAPRSCGTFFGGRSESECEKVHPQWSDCRDTRFQVNELCAI
jgi:Kef-type K+ transport system membrane component KefB